MRGHFVQYIYGKLISGVNPSRYLGYMHIDTPRSPLTCVMIKMEAAASFETLDCAIQSTLIPFHKFVSKFQCIFALIVRLDQFGRCQAFKLLL